MKTYKIHFTSDIYETVEVEASSKLDAQKKFDMGEVDFANAEEKAKENLKIDLVEEIQ